MKLLKQDRATGMLRVQVDTLDDLWHLQNLIQDGDLVTMDTYRTAETASDKIREGKAEKKRMRLGLRVENVEWHDFDDHLRIHGVIEEGPQDHGRHHTHIVRDDRARVDIVKRGGLQKWHTDLIKQAESETKEAQVVLLAIDDSEAQFAVLRGYGVQWLGSLPATGQGKRFDGAAAAKKQFYDEATSTLRQLRTSPSVGVLVVGPGWWREEFLEHVKQKDTELVKGILTDGTSQGGRNGVQEALKRGMIQRVARDHRVEWETEKVEKVMEEIAKDGLVAYGPEEVLAAVTAGAAEEVLITDKAIRKDRFQDVLKQAEATRCEVHVMASGHEAGARLDQFSGVAALLRFKV